MTESVQGSPGGTQCFRDFMGRRPLSGTDYANSMRDGPLLLKGTGSTDIQQKMSTFQSAVCLFLTVSD